MGTEAPPPDHTLHNGHGPDDLSPVHKPTTPTTIPPVPTSSTRQDPDALTITSFPSHYISKYTSFVRCNSAEITRFETLFRNLILFLPAHSSQSSAQLTTEAAHTLLTLLTTVHTGILAPRTNEPGYRPTPRERWQNWAKGESLPSAQNGRGMLGFTKGGVYKRAYGVLRLVQYIQLLLEMIAKRAGEGVRWRVVVVLESVKAICRFIMLRVSGNRPVISTQIGGEEQVRRTGDEEAIVPTTEEGWKMPRTGLRLPNLPSSEASETITNFLEQRVIAPDEVKAAQRLVRRLQSVRAQAAEIVWILRPVIYAVALQRVQGNRKDWRPWVVGVSMEVLSRQLAKQDVKKNVPGGLRGLSAVEKDELKGRGASMAWWGMRGAFYENVTGPCIKGIAKKLNGKPLLGMVGAVVVDYEWLWGEYYFSTATM